MATLPRLISGCIGFMFLAACLHDTSPVSNPSTGGDGGGPGGNGSGASTAGGTAGGAGTGGGTAGVTGGGGNDDNGTAGTGGWPEPSASANILIDLANVEREIHPLAIGVDESAYGRDSKVLPTDTVQQERLKALKPAHVRVELKYKTPGDPNSTIVCGAESCVGASSGTPSGPDYVRAIRDIGAEPIVIAHAYPSDVATTVKDAVNLVKYFKTSGKPIKRWIVSNEPDNGGSSKHQSASDYASMFNQVADAIKKEDAEILVAGPATAWFNESYIKTFLDLSGSRVDIVDFHQYGQGGTDDYSEAELFIRAERYTTAIDTLRAIIEEKVPARATQIQIQVGEWNLDWNADPKQYTQFNTVWSAVSLGRIVAAGGLSLPYATKNGALGMLYESDDASRDAKRNDPMPLYYGVGMFTGMSLFRGVGSRLVNVTTTLSNVNVWAFDDPKAVVLVNTSSSQSRSAVLGFTGARVQSAAFWQKDQSGSPLDPPRKVATVPLEDGAISVDLPAYSVTTCVLD
jgi:hypothetical protein